MHPCYLQKMQHEAQVRLYLDGCDGEGDLPPTIDVRVQNTKNVLELLRDDQRLKTQHTHTLSGRHESVSTAMFVLSDELCMLTHYKLIIPLLLALCVFNMGVFLLRSSCGSETGALASH